MLYPSKDDLIFVLSKGNEAEKAEITRLLQGWVPPVWVPFPGPQTMAYNSTADELFYGGGAGGGKLLDMRTPIPTPCGWKQVGEIKVGDVLYDEQGQRCNVLQLSDVEDKPVSYRITFDDGSTVDCCADHRWLTFDAKELKQLTRCCPEWRAKRRASRASRVSGKKSDLFSKMVTQRNMLNPPACKPAPTGAVRTTQEIAETLLTWRGRTNHAIPVAKPIDCNDVELPVDPYVLGAWLGDGSKGSGQLTGIDPEIWNQAEKLGYSVTHAKDVKHHYIRGLVPHLRKAGVLGCKHVPLIYLRSSYQQRLSLLQGLMDTDGHAALDGGCEFDNTNKRLVDAVYELVASLGIKATVQQGKAKLNGRIIGDKWRVKFATTIPVFRLKRKLDRLPKQIRRTQQFRYIVACDPIDPVPMRCIAVDSPSRLFLCGKSFIPTHNSDLLLGMAITKHRRSLILRREQTQLTELVQRSKEIIESLGGFNGTTKIWSNLPGDRRIEFGGCEHDDDKQKYKGRPHDLKGFDEGTDFLESQYDFIGAWNRTAFLGQKCTRMLTGNPPQTAEGEWVLRRWAAWIDPTYHGTKAKPGELRWYARVDGAEIECESGLPFEHKGRQIRPWSRTFVPALVDDNPVYMATGYDAVLDALPEPLRSMMRAGDFGIGRKDDEWQVIPTAWVQAAIKRWTPDGRETYLDAIGLDVARGGKDKTILAKRYGNWLGELSRHPGKDTPDGQHILRLLEESLADEQDVHHAITHIDATGVGSSPTDLAIMQGINVNPVIFGAGTHARDRSGRMKFRNQRAWLWWNLRDMLDPDKGDDLALPPDQELLSDLTSARWKYTASGILLEEKEETIKRIGRSPDAGEAVVLACYPGGDAKIETDSYHKPGRRAGLGR